MPTAHVLIEYEPKESIRCKQVESLFDLPPGSKQRIEIKGEYDFDKKPWNVGLIIGASGSGKTLLANHLFGSLLDIHHNWGDKSVIDGFPADMSVKQIGELLGCVGFNTIPNWLRPYAVLSNGEKFRTDIARHLAENNEITVIDEFTSVVDRQVAQIASNAVQKYIRRTNRQFIAVSCHSDIIEWLQPDWIIELPAAVMTWRSVRRRPQINVQLARVPYSFWHIFAKYHYMSAELNSSAMCYCLFIKDNPVAFCAVLHYPHPKTKNLKRISRIVTIPDYQGLGLAFVLSETLGAMFKSIGYRFRNYPAHPSFIKSHDRNPNWSLVKKPLKLGNRSMGEAGNLDCKPSPGRPCAVFEYIGAPYPNATEAQSILATKPFMKVPANA